MTGRFRIGVAAGVALLLTSAGLLRLLAPGTWIWPVIGVIMVATLSGEAARRLIRPRPLVIVAQLVAVFWYDMVLLAHEVAFGGVLPTFAVFHRLGDLYRQGADDINHTVPGGPSTAGIAAILVLSLGALAVLVDALAATYAVAPLAGLPLLALYLVPATRVGGGMDWLAFTVAAAGYTALLSAEGRDRLGRWGRPLVHAGSRRPGTDTSAAARPARVDTGPIAATGHQITMLALVAAVLAPLLLPTVSSGLFGLGPGNGDGDNGATTAGTKLSQVLNLKANLVDQKDIPLLNYSTTSGDPMYIRLGAQDEFIPTSTDSAGWSQSNDVVNQQMSPPGFLTDKVPGLAPSITPGTDTATIHVINDTNTQLPAPLGQAVVYSVPAPYPAEKIDGAGGDWTYDSSTLSVFRPQQLTKGFTYKVSDFDVAHAVSNNQLEQSKAITPDRANQLNVSRDLATSGFPDGIKTTAEQVVADAHAKTPIDMARALNAYFKDSKKFTYSLTDLPPGTPNAVDGLNWMLTHRSGYCVYFASTMTAMARELGIPARVAVGFTGGTKNAKGQPPGSYTVTSHDYHSWPELYFDGIGWLRFEPTVGIDASSGGGHGEVPFYAAQQSTSGQPTTAPTTQSGSTLPSSKPTSTACTAAQRKAGNCDEQNTAGTSGASQPFGYLGWFGAVPRFLDYWLLGGSIGAIIIRFVLLVLVLIGCVPMAVRLVRRRRRLTVGRRSGRRRPEEPDTLAWESADAAPAPTTDPERLRILAAWAEVKDSATDLGYRWPASETPRQSAERIIKQARFAPSAQDAMDRITGLAERASYARTIRPGSAPATLFDDVRTIRSGLAEPVSRRARLRATVLPASALAALRDRREELTGRVYDRVQQTGSRLRPQSGRRPGAKE